MALCSFTKKGFKASKEIDILYDKKIALFMNGRAESRLIDSEKALLLKLKQAKYVDPRHVEVCFGLEEEAEIGITIAHKLERMSDEEFLVSSYPYQWLDELKQKTICRITNKDGIDALKKMLVRGRN